MGEGFVVDFAAGFVNESMEIGDDDLRPLHVIEHVIGDDLATGVVAVRNRNKRTRQQSDVGHSHLLLHLPAQFRVSARRDVDDLVTLVAGPILDDRTIELTFPHNPDGKYLLKGGTPAVWEAFGLPPKWRSKFGEGLIAGKRCGTTQNIGRTARRFSNIESYGVNLLG
jgi:hypothetical protein